MLKLTTDKHEASRGLCVVNMQVRVAKYVNSVSKPGLQTGMHTGRHV